MFAPNERLQIRSYDQKNSGGNGRKKNKDDGTPTAVSTGTIGRRAYIHAQLFIVALAMVLPAFDQHTDVRVCMYVSRKQITVSASRQPRRATDETCYQIRRPHQSMTGQCIHKTNKEQAILRRNLDRAVDHLSRDYGYAALLQPCPACLTTYPRPSMQTIN